MCTVSWVHDECGYQLLCNRDEKKTRPRALGPRVDSRGGVRFIAPCDPVGGGAWIAVNEFGLSLCLLNAAGPAGSRSRGLLVLDLITAQTTRDAEALLAAADLSSTSPLTVSINAPGAGTSVVAWDGRRLVSQPARMPLTSSSFDTEAVTAARRHEFERRVLSAGTADPGVLHAFHESHGPGPSAFSACMHRDDAETVSFSWIKVSKDTVDFFYTPAAPCRWHPGETYRLARRRKE